MTANPEFEFQKGDFVRFKHLPVGTKPTPIRVTGITLRGMLLLEGRTGPFAPKLFVLVDPQEMTA